MTRTLKMVFEMPTGGTFTQSLADPVANLPATQCRTYMNEVITNEGIIVGGASPSGVKEMYIHTVDDVELT